MQSHPVSLGPWVSPWNSLPPSLDCSMTAKLTSILLEPLHFWVSLLEQFLPALSYTASRSHLPPSCIVLPATAVAVLHLQHHTQSHCVEPICLWICLHIRLLCSSKIEALHNPCCTIIPQRLGPSDSRVKEVSYLNLKDFRSLPIFLWPSFTSCPYLATTWLSHLYYCW